ncbi:hypothetical protein WN944_012349 [Citrus x changshan-huyou]|uniref:CLAVATA3/ESR (CLE)-related protein n=1 Tax=Citrus x changshan-huyou TaxID=2935761 RepID=A0AAP0QUH8_9ROSI
MIMMTSTSRMCSLRCLIIVCLTLVLLLSARAQSRPLTSFAERRKNLSSSIETTKRVARDAIRSQNVQPDRTSPGGPDPHHHSHMN